MRRLSKRAPLLIGVTGSRFFDRFDPVADRVAAAIFAQRMSACLAYFDHHFPQCPKVLLCGAAFGVDLVAAQAALERGCHWSVAALLPFERALFQEDFAADEAELAGRWEKRPRAKLCDGCRDDWMKAWMERYAEHRTVFETVLAAGNGRVLVREMPRLQCGARTATDAELSRSSPTRDAALRREHYEQVGLWIAESATVLFAYTSESGGVPSAAADGGTARVVACRRTGQPDRAGRAVAARSAVLRREWSEVLRSHGRDVWLVEAASRDTPGGDPPAIVLGRCSAFDRIAGRSAFDPNGGEGLDDESGTESQPALIDTLRVPALIERVHCRAEAYEAEAGIPSAVGAVATRKRRLRVARELYRSWRNPALPVATSGLGLQTDIIDLRRRLGAVQGRAKLHSERAFLVLALMFVIGVTLFELFADLFGLGWPLLFAYLALVALSTLVVSWADRRRWQPMSEDCRSVSEMLRVQAAWWGAGLGDRVDREHLQGVGRDLAHIPETVTTLLAWIWLTGESPSEISNATRETGTFDWISIRGRGTAVRAKLGKDDRDWIGGQWSYFAKRIPERNTRAHRTRVGSLFLFTAAWWLVAIVVLLFDAGSAVASLDRFAQSLQDCKAAAFCGLSGAAVIALAPFWWRLHGAGLRRKIRGTKPHRGLSATAAARSFGLPLVSAIGLALFAFAAAPALPIGDSTTWFTTVSEPDINGYRWISLVLVAVLIAVSGAWRYVTEKSGCEAEALEYSDAHRRFRLAEYALAEALDTHGSLTDVKRAQSIIKDLGRMALTENEAWLKSRRERPLTTL